MTTSHRMRVDRASHSWASYLSPAISKKVTALKQVTSSRCPMFDPPQGDPINRSNKGGEMQYPIDEYKTQAATAFTNLLKTFKTWGNGWQLGNVFDTMTDYVVRFPKAERTPGEVVAAAHERWGIFKDRCHHARRQT